MKTYNQWILWAKINNKKVPVSPKTFKLCDPTDPKHYVSYAHAKSLLGNKYGVAFVVTKADPFFFLDIDKCFVDNSWSALAIKLSNTFTHCFQEISDSSKGLHIIGSYDTPIGVHKCKNNALGLELYSHSRFIAITEKSARGDAKHNYKDTLQGLITEYFSLNSNDSELYREWTDTAVPEWSGPAEDEALLNLAFQSSSKLSLITGKASFKDLWEANEDILSKCYPDNFSQGRNYDGSSVDAALAQHLAFWTGNNHERIKSMMSKSKLSREKWEREDYLVRTITQAVNRQKEVYGSYKAQNTEQTEEELKHSYLAGDLLKDYFSGCVYVSKLDKILIPNGELLNQSQFNAFYSRGNVFSLNPQSTKSNTPDPWKGFLRSKWYDFPKANREAFRPDLKPQEIFKENNILYVNSYIDLNIPSTPGDPGLITEHIIKLFPAPRDQQVIISYMAACIQFKGVKFNWAPIIQGVPGNGKSLLSSCLEHVIGYRYTHRPRGEEITDKFNGWMADNLLIIVEDALISDSDGKKKLNDLKPMITQRRTSVQKKQVNAESSTVCCNFFFSTNYKDAIKKESNDRRLAVFFTPQQSKEDLEKYGMTTGYFKNIFDWLEKQGGYAIVHHWLKNYKIIDSLNPALGGVAPLTTSVDSAIAHSRDSVSDVILEAVQENIKGFSNGWISTYHLRSLLMYKNIGTNLSNKKQKDILHELGYFPHPGLAGGRLNNPVDLDGGKKSRLYITFLHRTRDLKNGAEISTEYVNAQNNTNELTDLI